MGKLDCYIWFRDRNACNTCKSTECGDSKYIPQISNEHIDRVVVIYSANKEAVSDAEILATAFDIARAGATFSYIDFLTSTKDIWEAKTKDLQGAYNEAIGISNNI